MSFRMCCIQNCKSSREDRVLHKFPVNENRLSKWLESIKDESITASNIKKLHVCDKHFEKRFINSTLRLRTVAYPSLFTFEEISRGVPDTGCVVSILDHSYHRKKHHDHTYSKQLPSISVPQIMDKDTSQETSPDPDQDDYYSDSPCQGFYIHNSQSLETASNMESNMNQNENNKGIPELDCILTNRSSPIISVESEGQGGNKRTTRTLAHTRGRRKKRVRRKNNNRNNLQMSTKSPDGPEFSYAGYDIDAIPEFDPTSKEQSIITWIKNVEECAETYGWDEKEILKYILPKLRGAAKLWCKDHSTLLYTWSEWKKKLVESFNREDYAQLLIEMLSKRVGYSESLEDYFHVKINLINRCRLSSKEAVDCLLNGVDDMAVKTSAQTIQFSEPEQVLKYFRSLEDRSVCESNNNFKS